MTEQSHRGGEQSFRSARIFDGTGPGGRPHVDRKMLDEGEAGRVLAYLEAAPVVHATDDYGHDRIDPGRGRSVPLTWQTDGTWVWPGAVSHYLRCYALPPDPEFLAHIRKRGFQLPAVPSDVRQAALAAVSSGPPDGMARRPAATPAGRFVPRDASAGAAGPAGAGAPGLTGAGAPGQAGAGTPGPAAAGPVGAGLGVGAGPRTAAAGPPAGRNGLATPPSRLLAGAHQDIMGVTPGNAGPRPAPSPQGPAGNGSQGGPPPLGTRPATRLPDPVGASLTVSLGASAAASGLAGTPNAASNGSRPPANGSVTPEHDGGPVRATGSRNADAWGAGKTADEPVSRGFSTIAAALGAPGQGDPVSPPAARTPPAARPAATPAGSGDRKLTLGSAAQPPAAAGAGPRAAGSPALRVAASRAAANTVPSPDGAAETAPRRPDSVFTPATTPATATNPQPAPLRTPGYGAGGSATPSTAQPPAVPATEAMAPAAAGAGNPPAAGAGSPRQSGTPADRGAAPASAAGLFGSAPASTPPVAASTRAQPASGGGQHSHAPRARLGRGDQATGGPPPGDRGAGGRSLGEPWSGRAGGPEPSARPHRPAGGPPHLAPARPSGRGTAYRTTAEAPADDSSIFDRLRAVAVELGLSTRAYRVGAAAEGSWSVLREDSGWAVFRTEHGVRHDLAAFPTSLQAAAYLIGQLYLARDVAGAAAPARRATAGFDQEFGTRNEPRHRPSTAVACSPTGADAGSSGSRAGGPSAQDAGPAPVTEWAAGAARLGTAPADLDLPKHPTRTRSAAGPLLLDDIAREPAPSGDSTEYVTAGPAGPSRPAADEPASTDTTDTRVVPEDAHLARGRDDAAALPAPAIEPAEAADLSQDLSAGDGGALATEKPDGPAAPVAAGRPAPSGLDEPPVRRTASREPDLGSAAATTAADVRTTAAAEPPPRPSSSAAPTGPTPDFDKPVKAAPMTLAAGPATSLAGSRPDEDSPDALPATSSQVDMPLTLGGRDRPTATAGLDAGSSSAGYPPSPAGPRLPQVGARPSAASASSLVTPRRTATPTSSGAAASHHAAADEHPWASPAAVPAVRPPASTPLDAPQADRPARRSAGDAAALLPAPAPPDVSTLRSQEPLRDGAKDSTSDSSQQSPAQWKIQPMPGEPPLTLYRDKRMVLLPAGTELDRYGDSSGNVTYAARTPYPQRSLPTDWNELPYHAYRLRRPVEALSGLAVPWFEQPGGGPVFVLASSVADLVAEGSLVEIEGAAPPA